MSSPSMPAHGPAAQYPAFTSPPSDLDGSPLAVIGESGRAIEIEAARGGPPQEVLEQMAAAARIHEQLAACGRQLRFHVQEPGAGAGVELVDSAGGLLRALTIGEALDAAAGRSLE